jgi:hypothetical protein
MDITQARNLLRNRPTWELRNMTKALNMLPWLNTPEDELRLKAAILIINERKGK